MIGERLGRMEANNVGQQQPIHCNQFPIGLRPQQAEGDAVPWYQWLEHSMGQMTWEQFKRALQTRFGSLEEANAGGTLPKLRQTGTIKDYQLQFERLANRIRDLPESFLISCFLSGLRDDVKVGVQLLKPVSLLQAFELARFQEELVSVANQKMNHRSTFTRSLSTLPGPSQLASISRAHTSSTPSLLGPVPSGLPPYHRLSAAEQAERRTKGLLEDGGVINSSGKCYDVPVSIQGFQFQLYFYLLPVSGCDIMLGAEWLQSLGAILWDFSKLTMQFSWKGHNVQLTGNGSPPTVLAGQGEFKRLLL
ncbi:hypothetical protein JRO89_XS11G0091300 [Xanthoceras sorbifolium]|uniref:Retrotransposon gag domain-containing protein n=1 Tax=Xanthoceras sorbifolium TaxID=99658 RepID=A0ABQ8HF62_9ROSI|nr:hypothetical protein JRO89_XS11G0091300 [Xanthoceras sorbifolium]